VKPTNYENKKNFIKMRYEEIHKIKF
jgi:hypothetical protein